MSEYHINIPWSDEDGGYIADIPDLVVCRRLASAKARAGLPLETIPGLE